MGEAESSPFRAAFEAAIALLPANVAVVRVEQAVMAALGAAAPLQQAQLREQLAAANERAETAEAELRAERECESEADLLHATGPTSIVLGVIRARHKNAGHGGWASRDRSMVLAGFDDLGDRQFALHAHDDIAGLLGIVERAHRDLRIMFEEHRGLRARLDGLGELADELHNAETQNADAVAAWSAADRRGTDACVAAGKQLNAAQARLLAAQDAWTGAVAGFRSDGGPT
jgi:hypothetical protein